MQAEKIGRYRGVNRDQDFNSERLLAPTMLTFLFRAFRAPGIVLFVSIGYLLLVGVSLSPLILYLVLMGTTITIGWNEVMNALRIEWDLANIKRAIPVWILPAFGAHVFGYFWLIVVSLRESQLIVAYLLMGAIGIFAGATLAMFVAMHRGLWPPRNGEKE